MSPAHASWITVLWQQNALLGSEFFGGIVGNLLAQVLWQSGQFAVGRLIDHVPLMADRLRSGGPSGNFDVLRALRRAEAEALIELVDNALLDRAGLAIGQGSVVSKLMAWVKAHSDNDVATLLTIRRACQRTSRAIYAMPVAELLRLHGSALENVQDLVRAGMETVSLPDEGHLREQVLGKYLIALEDALTGPARFAMLSEELAPISPDGIPPILRLHMTAHPGGWWDAIRTAFRAELTDTDHPAARHAWEIDMQCLLAEHLGTSFADMSARLDIVDAANNRQWDDWREFRHLFDRVSEDLLEAMNDLGQAMGCIQNDLRTLVAAVPQLRDVHELLMRFDAAALQELDLLKSQHGASLEEQSVMVGVILDRPNLAACQIRTALPKVLAAYRELRSELRDLTENLKDLPDISAELDIAQHALDAGSTAAMARADQALEGVGSRFRCAVQSRRLQEAEIQFQLLSQRARLALARLRFIDAASLWKEAGNCLLPEMHSLRARALFEQGYAHHEHCLLFGGTHGLKEAVRCFNDVLTLQKPSESPAHWAATQNYRANALRRLGYRLGGSQGLQSLRDAVSGYEAALQVFRQEVMPASWAATQHNRATALRSLGDRLGGEAGLQALRGAIAGYDEALTLRRRKGMPAEWAATQNNRAAALRSLGDRLGGCEGRRALVRAVAGFNAALKVRTFNSMPTQWAATQSNRGNALESLSTCLGGDKALDLLREAVACHDAALLVYTREAMPSSWATTQNNRATVLLSLGNRLGGNDGIQLLRKAILGFNAALSVQTREHIPAGWARTQHNRATALQSLGGLLNGKRCQQALRAAVSSFEAAMTVRTRKAMPADWAASRNNCATALQLLGDCLDGDEGVDCLRDAVKGFAAALEVYAFETMPVHWAGTLMNLATTRHALGERLAGPEGTQALHAALAGYEALLQGRTDDASSASWGMLHYRRAHVLERLAGRFSGVECAQALRNALAAYDAALQILALEGGPALCSTLQQQRAAVLQAFDRLNDE